jgi:predicted membrane protein
MLGYTYPNECVEWSVLIVIYPYITGLVAGAFTVASLERIFNVKSVKPTYRLSLLTALAFLIAAPLPLIAHLGHPERAFEIMFTPHLTSAMAVFGFVYAWYLLGVLLLEIYYDYRKDIVKWAEERKGLRGIIYRILTFGYRDVSEESVKKDEKIVYIITLVGLPSACLLHGYVGFIFGSVKANIWWSTPLMPIMFLFSAMVSGIALIIVIYVFAMKIRKKQINVEAVDTLASFLLYTYILDTSIELLEVGHVMYMQEEGFELIVRLISNELFASLVVIQFVVGALIPMIMIIVGKRLNKAKVPIYTIASILTLIGILAMRWNVVIGGQMISKSMVGILQYHPEFFGKEGIIMAMAIMVVPFVLLAILTKILPPWEEEHA